MHILLQWFVIGLVGGLAVASFFEWTLHRFVMHRPFMGFVYPFRAHALVHHRVFRADETYHLMNEKDKSTIPMAWWNGPAIVAGSMVPVAPVAWVLGSWELAVGALLAFTAYFCAYEYLHWCMHLPKHRRVERSGLFFRLNGHHLLHHRWPNRNFNVVLPLADLCLGTLLRRSPVSFRQAVGASVPDVQPRPKRARRVRETVEV